MEKDKLDAINIHHEANKRKIKETYSKIKKDKAIFEQALEKYASSEHQDFIKRQ